MASGLPELAAAPHRSPAAPGPARFDGCGQSAARREFAADHTPFRPSGLDDIAQDAVHRILVEDARLRYANRYIFRAFSSRHSFLGW